MLHDRPDQPARALRRPRLLIRAARFGLSEYRRTPALRRMLAASGAHSPVQVVALLVRARPSRRNGARRATPAIPSRAMSSC
jgi:hypothetical protein